MSYEEALIAARPPAPQNFELDERSLHIQNVIAHARLEAYEIVGQHSNIPYFHRASTLAMTQEEPLVPAIANIAAFALGMTDERNATPTIEHMMREGLVVGRNADTAQGFKDVITGSQEKADTVINRVFIAHAWVHAKAMAQARGPHPERVAHDPFDTDRASWTVGCLEWGTEEVFNAIVRPFSGLERPILRKIDYPLFGGFFGSEVHENPHLLVRERIDSGELQLTKAAKLVAEQNWHNLPVPRWMLPARKQVIKLVEYILPEEIREMYGIPDDPNQEENFQTVVRKLARLNTMLKLFKKDADSWLFGLAASEEAKLKDQGLLPDIPDPYAVSV